MKLSNIVASTLAVFALCLGVAGCTGYGDKLKPEVVQSFNLQQVAVSVPPEATFYWGDGERAYARSIGQPDSEAAKLGETPQGKTYMRNLASQRIKTAFDRALGGKFQGSRPVRIEIVMHDIYVSSPLQRILVGGDYSMKATANLVDAKTGQVIAANPNLSLRVPAGQGILGAAIDPAFGEPIDRVATRFAESYREWLGFSDGVRRPDGT
jgi:hypothetical protein